MLLEEESKRKALLGTFCTSSTLSFRALFVRSVTTRVLGWGDAERQSGYSSATRTPALFTPNGLLGVGVKQISAGGGFCCAVTWRGELVCWGKNERGQCGVHPSLAAFVEAPTVLPLPSTVLCDDEGEGQTLCGSARDDFFRTSRSRAASEDGELRMYAQQVACGLEHAVCTTTSGHVLCWGSNARVQLGRRIIDPDDSNEGPTDLAYHGGG